MNILDTAFLNKIQSEYNSGKTWKYICYTYEIPMCAVMKLTKNKILISRTRKQALELFHKNNPQERIRMAQSWTPERRRILSEYKKELFRKHPEKHALHKFDHKKLTYPERIAYNYLNKIGVRFEPQFHIDRFWVDYLIVDINLVIEIDGVRWHENRTSYDENRDSIIKSKGYSIIRIPANSVIDNLNQIFNTYSVSLDLYKIRKDIIVIHRKKVGRIKHFCECGKEKCYGATKCMKCNIEKKRKFNPTKEHLEILLKTNTLESIGKLFGVSGNSVKKRCVKFGIL